jgi:uncharacterized sporulation protein YeaH/YhbH (DUF444 family)
MQRIGLLMLLGAALWGADNPSVDNPWAKVRELKSRSELRIYKKGAREPLIATLDEVTEDRILIVVKNEQMSVPKEDIDRLDARPAGKTPSKIVKETTAKTTEPDYTPHPPGGVNVPGESYNTSVSRSSGSKPDFETVYRRPPGTPKK